MANTAEEIALNAATDAWVTAWGALIAAKSAGNKIHITFPLGVQRGVTAATPPTFTAGKNQYVLTLTAGTEAADNLWGIPDVNIAGALGFTPIICKVANGAGDMASS